MVFLANILRDVIKASHRILATTGASSAGTIPEPLAPSSGDEKRSRASAVTAAVVVEYSSSEDRIRVRPANDSDGAVDPF